MPDVQREITAEAEFNEVFFDNVRIPQLNMLGKEGQGWRVAIGGGGPKKKGAGGIAQVVQLWQRRKAGGLSPTQEVIMRDRAMRAWSCCA